MSKSLPPFYFVKRGVKMPDIDSLQIKIDAEATKANDAIDKLCGKIDRLTTSMNKLENVKIQNFSNSIKIFSDGMKNLQNIKTPDFNRVAKGLEKISSVNSDDVLKFGNALTPLANGINILSTANFDSKNLQGLLNSVSKLSSANVGSLNNVDFAQIGNNINQLTSSLANAPKIQQSVISMTNAIGNLAKFGENIPIVSNSLGSLGTALNKFISDMSNGASISDSTINFANAIGLLAKSGNTMPTTISNLSALGIELKKLMKELSTAPKVSQNLIDMTNALAKFARTGSSSGKAANSLVSSFNRISKASSGMKVNLLSAVNGISAIRKSILQAMGIAGGFYAVFQGIKESINIASDLTEVQNVVDVTFGDFKSKMEDLANVSITELGMSKLTAKEIGSRFQAMGTAIGFTQGKMADMSVELTRLAGDMSSFYNVEQKDVAKSLQSIFTGETEPMRKYGVDLTNATLKEWALKKGMDANISSMSQMQKTALRYQYVLEATGAAQGDFLITQDTWANKVRILKENFRELASVIGSSFIHALKPLVKALNSAMSAIISFAKVVSNALGKIFGWQYEDATGGIVNDYEDAADAAGDLADGTGKAADNAKKLKQQLQGIDELNVLTSDTNTGTSGGSVGGGSSGGSEDSSVGKWTKTDSILKDFESDLDTLYKLGEYIGETLTDAMKSIDWNSVYQGAKNFGSGLASFLNGLISPELFGEVGKTVAASLNTALYSLNSFGKTFDWKDFGESIASGINNFFSTFDFANVADTINVWVDGIKTTLVTAIKNIKWSDVIKGAFNFVGGLELDTIAIAIGAFIWRYKGKEVALSALSTLLSTEIATGIGTLSLSLGATIGLSITTAIVGFKIGETLYDRIPTVQECSDALVELIGGAFTKEYSLNDYIQGGIEMSIDIGTKIANFFLPDGSNIDASKISKNWLPKYISSLLFGDEADKKAATDYIVNIKTTIDDMKQKFIEKFNEVKEWAGKKAIDLAINILGSDKIEKLNDLKKTWDKLKDKKYKKKIKFKASIKDSVSSKLQNIKNLWEGFKSKKLKLSAVFTDTFSAPLKKAWNSIAKSINSYVDKIPVVGKKITNIPTFPGYALGGFPEDGWFRASHGEMIGRFDNGQSVVANNNQITDGISAAVQRGNQQMISYMQQEISELRTQNQLLTELLNKEFGISYSDVGKASQKYAREYTNRTGKPAYI